MEAWIEREAKQARLTDDTFICMALLDSSVFQVVDRVEKESMDGRRLQVITLLSPEDCAAIYVVEEDSETADYAYRFNSEESARQFFNHCKAALEADKEIWE